MKSRTVSFDLLKILCMLLIVIHHFSVYSGFVSEGYFFSGRELFVNLISLGGKIGVNVFMLISGYFLFDSRFRIKKLVHLELVTLFYSSILFFVFILFGNKDFSWNQLVINIMPTTFGRYWFIKSYMFVYVLSPYINYVLKAINKKKFVSLLIVLILFGSIMPSFSNIIIKNAYFDNTLWLLIIYVIGAFFKKFDSCFQNYGVYVKSFILTTIFLIFGCVVTYMFNLSTGNKISMPFYKEAYNIPIFITSIFLFLVFKTMTIKKFERPISKLSSLMFGVYLIHENFYMRELLWIKMDSFLRDKIFPLFILYSLSYVVIIFIICIIAEFFRSKVLDPIFDKLGDVIEVRLAFLLKRTEKLKNNTSY